MVRPRRQKAGETRERVLAFVRGRLLRGSPPTVREVQDAFGFRAVQSAQNHLEKLVKEGRLAKAPGRARGYRLPQDTGASLRIPVVGRVQAGLPVTAVESPEGYMLVDSQHARLSHPEELFALRVRGDSMTGAGILAGDFVIARRQQSAQSGEIVVALVGEEATVKTLRLSERRIELHPANDAFRPIVVERPDDMAVLGVVVEVRRYLQGIPA